MYSIKGGLGQSYTGDDVTVFSDGQPIEVFSDDQPIEVFSDFAQAIDSYEASMEVVGELQCALSQKGFDPGPLDGLWGSKTEKGLVAFAKSIQSSESKGFNAPAMAALGLDLAEVSEAVSFQEAAGKKGRPKAYIPTSVTRCGAGIFDIPGTAAAGTFLEKNWKWLAAAGVLTAGAIGVGTWLALRKKDDDVEREFGAIMPSAPQSYLYGNQYLQQTYGLGRTGRVSGTVLPHYAKQGMRGLGHKRSRPTRAARERAAAKRMRRGKPRLPTRRRGVRGMGLVTTDSVFTYQNPWLQQIYG